MVSGWMESPSGHPARLLHFGMTDSKGRQLTLTFGTDMNATDGFDTSLGEVPIPPPPPPGNFDLRFVDRPGVHRVPGDGSYVDFRGFHSRSQVDTFIVRFQVPNDAYPVRFFWDPVGKTFCDSMFVEFASLHGIERLDMSTRTMLTLHESDQTTLRIKKYGARK